MEHVQVLQDGFWERTSVVRAADGALLVQKESTAAGADSPWGQSALREEIRFLESISGDAKCYYPPLSDYWDDQTTGSVGYRIPYYEDYLNVSVALRSGTLSQGDADEIQKHLARAIFDTTHKPTPDCRIVEHVRETIEGAIARLHDLPEFTPCIEASIISLNGRTMPGLRETFRRALESPVMAKLGSLPTVRLHGDLILENVLWNPHCDTPVRLIDPVSVAGIANGPAAFDLVKYLSYATGELYALRSGDIQTGPIADEDYSFRYEPAPIPAFTRINLFSRFATAFEEKHGPRQVEVEHLLDGYFSLVMAVNTKGKQQWGRVLKGILSLNAALETLDSN